MIERTFIQKNFNKMELEDYLTRKLDRAGFSHLEIVKTPLVTRIVLYVAKPGFAIGKGGSTIKQLTDVIAQKYKIDNPQIEIQEIKNPNMNAKILAERMASMIQREFSWRSIAYRLVKDVVDAGAQGVELIVKGKLSGKGGRKKKVRIAYGYMKKLGAQTKMVDTAKVAAYPKAGAIGIKLSVISPNVVFPDKIDIKKVIQSKKIVEKETEEQKTPAVVAAPLEEPPITEAVEKKAEDASNKAESQQPKPKAKAKKGTKEESAQGEAPVKE